MTSGVVASDDPLAHQAYLGENQLQILRKYGTEQAVGDGDVLFVDGDHTYDLIVVLEGFVKVVEGYGKPDSDVIVTYGPNEFVGEMGLLTGQRVFLTGVASGSGRILRIPVEKVRSIMTEEPDLSELILRAFLFRRALLTTRGSGLTLVGSRFCAGTRRLLELLARNRLSSRWVELEGSAEVEAWLQELPVPSEDLPIVLVPGHRLLRNPSNRELLTALGLGRAVGAALTISQPSFGQRWGISPRAYINELRVEAAKWLLLETGEKLETVATQIGLHDASHLSRLFLKHAGNRPGAYRRQQGLDCDGTSTQQTVVRAVKWNRVSRLTRREQLPSTKADHWGENPKGYGVEPYP